MYADCLHCLLCHLTPPEPAAKGEPVEAFPLLEKGLTVAVENYNEQVRLPVGTSSLGTC
jgi:hypothetical protein